MNHDRVQPEFATVVEFLETRARHLLANEARVGKSSPIKHGGRLQRPELEGRLGRLWDDLFGKRADFAKVRRLRLGMVDTEDSLLLLAAFFDRNPREHFTRFDDPDSRMILHRLMLVIDVSCHMLESLDRAEADVLAQADEETFLTPKPDADGPDVQLTFDDLRSLAPGEIEVFIEEYEDPGGKTGAVLRDLLQIRNLRDGFQLISSEGKRLWGALFGAKRSRGAYVKERGRQLSAHLLGMAEGLGLQTSRNHHPTSGRLERSACDAVQHALQRCTDHEDPVAIQVHGEAPKTFATLIRNIVPASNPGREGRAGYDPILASERGIGRVLGERRATGHLES